MANPEDQYESVLKSRYCRNSPLLELLSEKHKIVNWRKLWIWLAESEKELGFAGISDDQLEEMREKVDCIDWKMVRDQERKVKHDVMAHIHAYGQVCPKAAGIIHMGATSCFVQDNADLIIQRDAVTHLVHLLANCMHTLGDFAMKHRTTVTVGRTHLQPASLVTVGKRACLWTQDLLLGWQDLLHFRDSMRFRGIQGATGTQDSFLRLFDGDDDKVTKLNDLITLKAGFEQSFSICGQTYSRQQDVRLMSSLSALSSAVYKVCSDVRILQSDGELYEPFEPDQIGSSAMPFKRNPILSERCCSLARQLMSGPLISALQTAAVQGLERTLDDSACRRMNNPDSLLLADALLTTFRRVLQGLTVDMDKVSTADIMTKCSSLSMLVHFRSLGMSTNTFHFWPWNEP